MNHTVRLMDVAWMHSGHILYTGESLVLACLLHAKGRGGRESQDMEDVRRIMKDPNRDKDKTAKPSSNK